MNTSPWNSFSEWASYWRSKGASDVTWATDGDGSLARGFDVRTLGTTVIIDRTGRISYRDGVATPYDILRAEITKVL